MMTRAQIEDMIKNFVMRAKARQIEDRRFWDLVLLQSKAVEELTNKMISARDFEALTLIAIKEDSSAPFTSWFQWTVLEKSKWDPLSGVLSARANLEAYDLWLTLAQGSESKSKGGRL